MQIIETKIKGVFVVEPEVFKDNRGWFGEMYNQEKLKQLGIDADFVQDNSSFTVARGTLRGLHFQNNPYAQAKLAWCTRGAVLDVVVDLRKDSPTYKQWVAVELTEANQKQLFIPKGLAHGFLTLTDNVNFQYKVDNYYNQPAERGIRFNDPEIGVEWGIDDPILSAKDQTSPLLKDSDVNF
jgi:dTDP-4-dehydrorhamnose 3,5-epimerase